MKSAIILTVILLVASYGTPKWFNTDKTPENRRRLLTEEDFPDPEVPDKQEGLIPNRMPREAPESEILANENRDVIVPQNTNDNPTKPADTNYRPPTTIVEQPEEELSLDD